MRFRIFILFFNLFFTFSYPQKEQRNRELATLAYSDSLIVADNNFVETDSLLAKGYTTENTITPRSFEENFHQKYKNKEYDYETVKPRESLLDRIERRISQILEAIFGKLEPNTSITATKMVFWLLIIAVSAVVLYFLLNYLLNRDGGLFFFSKKNSKNEISNEDLHENIHEINFPEQILKYENEKNYRWAIRYQFLYILKKFSDKKLIEWNPEKTNSDYLVELNSDGNKDKFQELMLIFDYVWYGEFDIDETNYSNLAEKFRTVKI